MLEPHISHLPRPYQLDDVFVNREHDPSAQLHRAGVCERSSVSTFQKAAQWNRGNATHHQTRQPGRRARPEAQEALLGEDPVRAVERVAVGLPGLEALHPCFYDAVNSGLSAVGVENTLGRLTREAS